MWTYRNIFPGFGSPADTDAPGELDYDLWLGPAPLRKYNPNRSLYHFRWFWDYSGGQMTNLGQHSLDVVHWFLDATAPCSVSSTGGRHTLRDNGETPDAQDASFDYKDWSATWSHRECSRGASPWRGLEFCGTLGSLTISRQGFVVTPDPAIAPENAIPQFGGPQPIGGPSATGDRALTAPMTTALKDNSGSELDQFRRHARNFIVCLRSRDEPAAGLEAAHRVATACHLANLSLRLDRKLRWDAERESITGDPEAEALLERPYRTPWDAEKRALLEVT